MCWLYSFKSDIRIVLHQPIFIVIFRDADSPLAVSIKAPRRNRALPLTTKYIYISQAINSRPYNTAYNASVLSTLLYGKGSIVSLSCL